jgi:outer membrane lipoprotein-sorting protein
MSTRAFRRNAPNPADGRRRELRRSPVSRRWAVPAAAVLGVGVVTAGTVVAPQIAGAVSGSLPARTPEQLLAAVGSAGARPLSGTVVETADLGLPALPGSGSATSLTSLISGSHTVRVWYRSATEQRLAVLGDLAETDLVRRGDQAWIWTSSANTAQHLLLPAGSPAPGSPTSGSRDPRSTGAELTPAAAAARAVAAVTPTTELSVDPTVRVAGRQAYQLVLRPRDAGSLVDRVTIAVDAATSVPLRVEIYAVGRTTASFSTAFTSVNVATPDASVFAFDPPAGAKVTTRDLRTAGTGTGKPGAKAGGAARHPGGVTPVVTGRGWSSVVSVSGVDVSSALSNGSGAAALRAATPVSGSFGTGRVLSTRLFSVLLLDNGRVLVGAVPPATLERAAAR